MAYSIERPRRIERIAVPTRERRRCAFVITEISEGCWVARDRIRGTEQTFATPRAAIRFALFEAAVHSDRACALIVPRRQPDHD
jgi:hypothetical protein